jgi:choice-of-anchor B domain-containing protein
MKIKNLLIAAFALFSIETNAQLNVIFQSQLTYPGQTCANICGYVDTLGNEYALVGASQGMSIVNVTDPLAPFEVMQIPNVDDLWKEIKVYGKYAYVTTEGGGGLQIVNLSNLPGTSLPYHHYTGDGAISGTLNTIHALHIDGHYLYLYGSNLFSGGAIVLDIIDPWNPVYLGKYDAMGYVHDGYVRNDTLYAGHIYAGVYAVVDFTDKTNPVVIATQSTPTNFTHNTWLSTDSRYLFTTDENSGSFLTCYDLDDLGNIVETDRIQSNPGSNSIGHNTHIINKGGNDYAVTSWYKDGFTIVDVGRPQNLVQVAYYDNYAGSGTGFSGAWGVYPYLPSGNIVVSNIDEGLFVFSPNYTRACYLEGTVNDSTCGVLLNDVQISIAPLSLTETTGLDGQYKTGTPTAGTYNVTFSKSGYVSKTVTNVILGVGLVTTVDVQLAPFNTVNVTGSTVTAASSTALPGTKVLISNASNTYNFTSDAAGTFNSCNVVGATDYDITVGKWGFETLCLDNQTINAANSSPQYSLATGYDDDFTFNMGWTVTGNATTGTWERGAPIGTNYGAMLSNADADVNSDCNDQAYVTGNAGGSAANDDVDDGSTVLTSPVFDLTGYTLPLVNYSRWFFTAGAGPSNDSLTIFITNGLSTVMLESVKESSVLSAWIPKTFNVSDFITPTATMQIIVKAEDNAPGHLVEGGFDKFSVTEGFTGVEEHLSAATLRAYPNPFNESITVNYSGADISAGSKLQITDLSGRIVAVYNLSAASSEITVEPEMKAGIYFANIVSGSQASAPVKIIKLH